MNKLVYDVNERPPFGKNLLYAFQQLLAIIAATVLVPVLVNGGSGTELLNPGAAMVGAGFGTIVYLLFTKFKSPVFLGSSFAFIPPLLSAAAFGYWGIMIGALAAGLVYVVLALVIHFAGSGWINKLMPPVIIGPVVALIGFSLAGSAVNNICNTAVSADNYNLLYVLVGLVTFLVTVLASVKGGKGLRMIPFIIGVFAGYALAAVITLIGYHGFASEYCKLIDFAMFADVLDFSKWIPNFTFVGLFSADFDFANLATVLLAFMPVAFVVFAEHVADHKNISTVINRDLLEDPGLDRTLLGDGVGSIVGAVFGGCPNTTYGESVGCVALTRNASVSTTFLTALMCIVGAFFYPALVFINTIPVCVVGGICIALYGFIAVSGLRMFKQVDLDDSRNLYVVASIFITGIGGLALNFGPVQITSIATALIIGIIVNALLSCGKKKTEE